MTTIASHVGVGTWDIPVVRQTVPDVQVAAVVASLDWSLPSWIKLPAARRQAAPPAQVQINEICRWTDLSLRRVAEMVGTSHPTLGALALGQTDLSKKPSVLDAIEALHSLVARLAPLADDKMALTSALTSEIDAVSIGRLAVEGGMSDAYLAALSLLRPGPPRKLRRGFATKTQGTSTVSLTD